MTGDTSRGTAISGSHAPDWGEATSETGDASRPSKSNCTTGISDTLPAEESTWSGYWWKQKNAIVDAFTENFPQRAIRPVSVRDDVKLREDCTAEKYDSGLRGKTMSAVLNEFLNWYNGYRHAHLLFRSPDGDRVRAPMPNSHQPAYGDKYYARLKALERKVLENYDSPSICMLSLTGSSRTESGGWRCPADHIRDVVNSWRPSRGRGVYHTLRDVLDGYQWEYALITEHHDSGYGHVHVAIFVDGDVSESDFRPVIDSHLRNCEIAGPEAHDYHHPDQEKRPISLKQVDTSFDAKLAQSVEQIFGEGKNSDGLDDLAPVSNVAGYLASYIGAHGKELFDRDPSELMFRAACWATGTQMVRFSVGANELIEEDREENSTSDSAPDEPVVIPNPDFEEDEEFHRDYNNPCEVVSEPWSLEGIGRVTKDGEEIFQTEHAGVQWETIEDASHLDRPSKTPFRRPRRRGDSAEISEFATD